jgi:adenylate kinase family enzyme
MTKRIVILGPSGTGKTTLCRILGEKFNISTLHLDSIYWIRDWNHLNKEQFQTKMSNYLKKHDEWVIDGNYTNNLHFKWRLQLASTIILLDYGQQCALKGIHERAKKFKHTTRSDMAEGCIEGIDQVFLKYVSTFSREKIPWLKAIINKYGSNKEIYVFRSRKELNKWLETL